MKLVLGTITLAMSLSAFAQSLPQPPVGSLPDNRVYQSEQVVVANPIQSDLIVLKKPAKLKYANIEANGDGTVTVFRPMFYYRGQWRRISSMDDTALAACKILNQNYQLARNGIETNNRTRNNYVVLDLNFNVESRKYESTVRAVYTDTDGVLETLTCTK